VTDSAGNSIPAPGASPEERYAQINYAVDSIESHAQGRRSISIPPQCLAGPWGGCLSPDQGGVERAQGFFLNVSNYQLTSDCIQLNLGLRCHRRTVRGSVVGL